MRYETAGPDPDPEDSPPPHSNWIRLFFFVELDRVERLQLFLECEWLHVFFLSEHHLLISHL